MKVLVAFECSGTVATAFHNKGHDAWSCDIKPSTYKKHVQGDVFDGILAEGWDLLIAHPPCTYLCVSGNRHYYDSPKRNQAIELVESVWSTPVDRMCIENPVGVLSTRSKLGKPTQYVHPYMFGDPAPKKTGLWLKGLPPLVPTNDVEDQVEYVTLSDGKRVSKWYYDTSCLPQKERAEARSKTFKGLAEAMAEQWG